MYFFNRYEMQLLNDKLQSKIAKTFYINKGSSITQKEGYNLLEGRAVHKALTSKQNEKYKAWVQLDFKTTAQNGNYEMKQYHQNFGYDMDKVLIAKSNMCFQQRIDGTRQNIGSRHFL